MFDMMKIYGNDINYLQVKHTHEKAKLCQLPIAGKVSLFLSLEPHHGKTCFLHMRKPRRRSAAQ